MNNRQQRTFHANNAVIKVSGTEIGYMQNVSFNLDSSGDYVYGIGSFSPLEINHNRGAYRVTFDTYVLRCNEGHRLQSFPEYLGLIPSFDVELLDQDSGSEWVAIGCELTSQTAAIRTNTRITNNMTALALSIEPLGGVGEVTALQSLPGICDGPLEINRANKEFWAQNPSV